MTTQSQAPLGTTTKAVVDETKVGRVQPDLSAFAGFGGQMPVMDSSSSQGKTKESFGHFSCRTLLEMTNIKFALASFVVNNLRRRYRRSILGFAWSLLNPLLTMGVMTLVFSLLFKNDPRTFAIFIFTGLLPWTFITDSITNGSQAITQNEHYLKKVYVPKLFFPLVAVTTEGANFVFSLSSLMIIGLAIGAKLSWTWLLVPVATGLLFVFAFSIAMFLAVATVYFRDLTHLIKVFLGLLFYTVPIIYPLNMVPEKYQFAFMLNPAYYYIDLFRVLIYKGELPAMQHWAAALVLSLASAVLCLFVLKRTERDIIYRL